MSLKSKLFWAGVGGTLIALLVRGGKKRGEARPTDGIPADPEVEAALDLQSLDVEDLDFVAPETVSMDAVEMYGAAHPDEDVAMETGQNWLEALETDAVEDTSQPELPIGDDNELDPASFDARSREDIPVADRGAGGPSGI